MSFADLSSASPAVDRLSQVDYFRGSGSVGGPLQDGPDVADYKEWHHFLIHTANADFLINFNFLRERHADRCENVARVIAIARTETWEGGVDRIQSQDLHFKVGEIDARFGANLLLYSKGRYQLSLDMQDYPIRAELSIASASEVAVLRNFPLAPARKFSWAFVPRLIANGWLEVNGRRHLISDAPAYHDHNWGAFQWADDFAWEWGSALPEDPQNPWSSVLVRASDRGRRSSRCQLFMLWRDDKPFRIFSDEDLTIKPVGRLCRNNVLKVPRAMGLLAPGSAWDVPDKIQIEAQREEDSLTYEFVSEDYSQVIVPNEGPAGGVTALCEVIGSVHLNGIVRGEQVAMSGRGVLELVR